MKPWEMMRRFGQTSGGGGGLGPILTKLTSWWEMGEASGTRYDSKGTNHLSVYGTVGTATGARGSGDVAASFAGAGALTIASNSSIQVPNPGPQTFCIFGWVYVNANTGAQFFVAKTDASGATSVEYTVSQQSGTYYGQSSSGASYINASQAAPAAGAWHFAVVWRDPADGKIRLQIDNGSVNVSAGASGPSANPYDLAFGKAGSSNTSFLSGRLQRWGWIKGAILSADERDWLYNAGSGRTYAELVAAGA